MSLSNVSVLLRLKATLTKTMTDGKIPVLNYTELFDEIPSDADALYTNGHSIASSGSVDLDLAGSLTDALGVAVTFSKVYAILVVNTATVTGRVLEVGGDSASIPFANAADNAMKVGPKGCFFLSSMLDGWTVTGTSADILQIANVAGGQTIVANVAVLGKA